MKRANRRGRARPGKSEQSSQPRSPLAAKPGASASSRKPFPIVGIGASAGGLEAFTELLQELPADTGMAFVLVQHLDPGHASVLTDILTRTTQMPVREVTNNMPVEPNHVYVIPPNSGLIIGQGVLKLHPRSAARPLRSIDSFFESLAEDQGEHALGVILSGTATDGTLGLEAIKAHDGITFAQDASAKYASMPQSAVAAGCVDAVLSPRKIAEELARIARHPYVGGKLPSSLERARPRSAAEKELAELKDEKNDFKKVLLLLRNYGHVDFSQYKPTTIQRRITRRMVLNKLTSLAAYVQFLRSNPTELDALFGDMLISVSSFFRNPDAYEALERLVFPKLLHGDQTDTIRVWVPGCSAGQEAYSLAILFNEYAQASSMAPKLQMFASDISDALLDKARAGIYPKALLQDVSPERLRRFFIEEEEGYRVIKPLRDSIVFAHQNLLNDPPFSRLDLITCRNLLIYLESSPQQTIIPLFHYALKPRGFLFLGASESVAGFTDLFDPIDRKHKIYSKKPGPTPVLRLQFPRPTEAKAAPTAKVSAPADEAHEGLNAQREADRIALNRYAAPGLLLNAEGHVLQFRGETSPYLKPPTGKATFNVINMARKGLALPLRNALQQAKGQNKPVRRENVRIEQDGQTRMISFEVLPLVNLKHICFLVFFEELREQRRLIPQQREPALPPGGAQTGGGSPATRKRVAELERELAESRDYLQSLEEQYEASNEELQASNEEVTSANEELQSINEELETSKEELESANEELLTVNDEMANRNAELSRLTSDLLNFQSAANMSIILLGRDQTIRRFATKRQSVFNLLPTDVGRSIHDIRHRLDIPDLERLISGVIQTAREHEHEVRDADGRWYSFRISPYRGAENNIDGAVLVLVDIDALKRNAEEMAQTREYAEAVLRSTRDLLVVLDASFHVHSANSAFYETFHSSPKEVEGRLIYELGNGDWDIPGLHQLLEQIVPRRTLFTGFEVTHDFKVAGRRSLVLNANLLNGPEGHPQRILLGIHDMTDQAEAEARMRRSEIRFRRLFECAKDGVLLLDPQTETILDANPFITELLGFTREELRLKQLGLCGLFAGPEDCKAMFDAVREHGVFRSQDLVLQARSGERRCVEFIGILYQENGGQIIQCNLRDISARKATEEALRESELRYRALAENVPQLIWTCNPDGQCDYLSPQWARYTGVAVEEHLGRNWLDAVHPDDREPTANAWHASVETRQGFTLEYRLRNAQGDYRWFQVRGGPLLDSEGTLIKWFGTCTDIDDQKRGKEILEQTVNERTAALRETVHELEAFSYSLSHDLRAPLRTLNGFADLLLQSYGKRFDDRARDYLQRIASASARLDLLIRDVLSYTRLLSAQVPRSVVNLDKLVREILQTYPDFQGPQTVIEVEGSLPSVLGHEGFLTQAISNLLQNAIKFVAEGVIPHVRVRAEIRARQPSAAVVQNLAPADGVHTPATDAAYGAASEVPLPRAGAEAECVRLWIEDNGVGIAPEYRDRIFRMFERIYPVTQYGGTGIGLTIVRKVVERMGGEVGFESKPGDGSQFWIELPKA
jgi:two-component system, chemotaxis family, CheB/CheR fusion protein